MAEKEEKKSIVFTDKVEVIATDKAPYHKKGEKFKVHPHLAEAFLEKGYVEKYSK